MTTALPLTLITILSIKVSFLSAFASELPTTSFEDQQLSNIRGANLRILKTIPDSTPTEFFFLNATLSPNEIEFRLRKNRETTVRDFNSSMEPGQPSITARIVFKAVSDDTSPFTTTDFYGIFGDKASLVLNPPAKGTL